MEAPVQEVGAPVTRDAFGSALDIKSLKVSTSIRICHELEYQGLGNRINSGFPVVCPTQSFRERWCS